MKDGLGNAYRAGLQKGLDWLVPYYRSVASLITFGMTPREIMLAQFAKAVDPSSGGRQMPGHYGAADRNILSVSSPVATQLLHATGIAWAAKVRKTGQVAITHTGEGSSNQGDVHEAMNFAGVFQTPTVFLCQNNEFAISLPRRQQTAAPHAPRMRSRDSAIDAGRNAHAVAAHAAEVAAAEVTLANLNRAQVGAPSP